MDERGALFDLTVSPSVRWKRISVSFEEDHPFASDDVSIDRRPRCIAILHRNFALPHILSFSLLYKLLCIILHNVSQILHARLHPSLEILRQTLRFFLSEDRPSCSASIF